MPTPGDSFDMVEQQFQDLDNDSQRQLYAKCLPSHWCTHPIVAGCRADFNRPARRFAARLLDHWSYHIVVAWRSGVPVASVMLLYS
jgi:hypothetical protein